MQKKIIVMTISAMGAVISTGVQAQDNQAALSPTERIVLGATAPAQAVNVPLQPTNPLGSIQQAPVGASQINYGGNGQLNNPAPILIPSNMSGQGAYATPSGLPTGLPDVQNQLIRKDKDELSELERTINILNTPDERIIELNKQLHQKGKILNQPAVTAAKPVNTVLVASLTPGATSPVVRLNKGKVGTIVITDATGKPWPIVNMDGLPEEDYIVNRLDAPAPIGHMLSITPLGQHVSGNLALALKDSDSPLVIEFVPAESERDAKTEIRVQALGPNAQFQSLGVPESINPQLLSLLQGVAPAGAKKMKTDTNAVEVWKQGSHMFVRTRYKVISPAPIDISSSPDGTYAYKMYQAPVVLYRAGLGKEGSFTVSDY